MAEFGNGSVGISAELLRRYDKPGPRYTSYPTVPQWSEDFGSDGAARALRRYAADPARPLSLYAHVPFCEERCLFCGCNVVIDRRRQMGSDYLADLRREKELALRELGEGHRVLDLHLGGGTPTHLAPEQLRELVEILEQGFALDPSVERSIEVDPMVTGDEHLQLLRELGFARISMGVQDLDPKVQAAIQRIQPAEQTRAFQRLCERLGFTSIHMDLIYGLPEQTPESFARTIETILAWQPHRISMFSYAHVPWMHAQQRRLDESALPQPQDKMRMLVEARASFRAAGYRVIGLDHFARPGDSLANAVDDGRIRRNFMGYTAQGASDVLAFGMSSISEIGGSFFQNESRLHRYQAAVRSGKLPVQRGMDVEPEDQRRAGVIHDLLCRGRVRWAEHGVDLATDYAAEANELKSLAEDGLLSLDAGGATLSESGQLLARVVAMVFDRHLGAKQARYSRTV